MLLVLLYHVMQYPCMQNPSMQCCYKFVWTCCECVSRSWVCRCLVWPRVFVAT